MVGGLSPRSGSILWAMSPDTSQQWASHARAMLQRAGHHRGAARDKLIDLLSAQDCALSALEIEDNLRRQGPVARASVYRALELLHDHELVTRLELGDGVARYEPADPDGEHHHHHMICELCGQLVPFDDAGLEKSISQLSRRLGFITKEHEVTLRGNCADCRAAA
jgi:Fur family ferric uptake transcriptional regulator